MINSTKRESETQKRKPKVKMLDEEMGRSGVFAYNLAELHMVLEETARLKPDRIKQKEILDWLEHENAHMNVAEATGHTGLRYLLLCVEDKTVPLGVSFLPVVLTDAPDSWTPEEVLEKDIQVLLAPRAYGNKLSPSDAHSLLSNRTLISKIAGRKNSSK